MLVKVNRYVFKLGVVFWTSILSHYAPLHWEKVRILYEDLVKRLGFDSVRNNQPVQLF